MQHYADSSALTKLVLAESETTALRRWLELPGRELVTSDLARTELMRAVRRAVPDGAVNVRGVIEACRVVGVDAGTFDHAGFLGPPTLRSLDAIHLASALGLGDDLAGIITYDPRLAEAANAYGIEVFAPA